MRARAEASRSSPMTWPFCPISSHIKRPWPAPPTVPSTSTVFATGCIHSRTGPGRTGRCTVVTNRVSIKVKRKNRVPLRFALHPFNEVKPQIMVSEEKTMIRFCRHRAGNSKTSWMEWLLCFPTDNKPVAASLFVFVPSGRTRGFRLSRVTRYRTVLRIKSVDRLIWN